jgi:hypothetical protein
VESLPRRVEAVIAAMFLHPVESLPSRVEAVIAAKGGPPPHINNHNFEMRSLTSIYFWSCSVAQYVCYFFVLFARF